MVLSVISAFNKFMNEKVNLDPDEVKLARRSRDWLVSQIHLFPSRDNNFPRLYTEKDIFFGSFARHTKKRELDDIDIMIALHAEGGSYYEYDEFIEIHVLNSSDNLKKLCHDNTNILNSRKVINKFIELLSKVPQYESAEEMKRDHEALRLNLKTYNWNFDIVPCFLTRESEVGKTYYLIPDGKGNWKKTDPRLDRDRVSSINQKHDGNILNVIRIIKYWNKRPTMPSMSSYLLENMILDCYENNHNDTASEFVDIELPGILNYIKDNIFYPVNDPKGIQGDLNTLGIYEQMRIYLKASSDYNIAVEARKLENKKQDELSIKKWADIFGDDFPKYG